MAKKYTGLVLLKVTPLDKENSSSSYLFYRNGKIAIDTTTNGENISGQWKLGEIWWLNDNIKRGASTIVQIQLDGVGPVDNRPSTDNTVCREARATPGLLMIQLTC